MTSLTQPGKSARPRPAAWSIGTGIVGLLASALALPACGALEPSPARSATTTASSQPADVQLQLLGAPSPAQSSQAITVTATVRNLGPQTAQGLQLTLQVTAGADAQIHHQPEGVDWTCDPVSASGQTTCTLQTLGYRTPSEVWLAVLPDVTADALSATAMVTALGEDPDPTNNQASLRVPIQYNSTTYRAPGLAGGGFGCSVSGRQADRCSPVLGLLLLGALWRVQRRRPGSGPTPRGATSASRI